MNFFLKFLALDLFQAIAYKCLHISYDIHFGMPSWWAEKARYQYPKTIPFYFVQKVGETLFPKTYLQKHGSELRPDLEE